MQTVLNAVKAHNFSAGPGILPADVLKQAAEACINFDNLNLSLLEISHRSKNFEAVMDESRELIKELLGLSSGWQPAAYRWLCCLCKHRCLGYKSH
jgi:phosphoserine aminotransferase